MAFDGENLQAGNLNRQPQDNTAIVLASSYLLGSCMEKANFSCASKYYWRTIEAPRQTLVF